MTPSLHILSNLLFAFTQQSDGTYTNKINNNESFPYYRQVKGKAIPVTGRGDP
jgi:hypothetical protein